MSVQIYFFFFKQTKIKPQIHIFIPLLAGWATKSSNSVGQALFSTYLCKSTLHPAPLMPHPLVPMTQKRCAKPPYNTGRRNTPIPNSRYNSSTKCNEELPQHATADYAPPMVNGWLFSMTTTRCRPILPQRCSVPPIRSPMPDGSWRAHEWCSATGGKGCAMGGHHPPSPIIFWAASSRPNRS